MKLSPSPGTDHGKQINKKQKQKQGRSLLVFLGKESNQHSLFQCNSRSGNNVIIDKTFVYHG